MTQISRQHRFIALKTYLHYVKPFRMRILFVLALFLTSNILLAVIPVFIGLLVQTLTQPPIDAGRAWLFAWILVGLSSFHDVLWRGSEFAYRGLLNEMTYRYETYLFKAVITKPYPYFVDKLTGKIGSYITTIGKEFRNLLGNVMFDGMGQIVGIVATAAILGSLNWQTGTVFIAGLIAMLVIGKYTLGRNMKDEARATDRDSDKNGILYDAIANYASIKAFKTEYKEYEVIETAQTKTVAANQKAFLSGIVFWASMSLFVRHIMWTGIVLMNVWFFFQGQLSIGQLATLLSTVLIFSGTVWQGIWYISQLGQQMARVNEAHVYLFGTSTDLTTTIGRSNSIVQLSRQLALKNISFAYPDKPHSYVLKDISLSIPRGQKVGVVGKSGSGKTTLTKLLLGFYAPTAGQLVCDDTPADIAHLISFVPQDTALFHRSIADNIAYGCDEDISRDAIKRAAKQSYADEFIATLPDGYDTLIGERGIKLSGGQRQRVAIARAMLQDKPILLLDEATSALDSESELLIQKALHELWQDKTVIAIAHRLSTLRDMDRIVVMEAGRIVEDGTHTELLKQNGTYAKLWSHQSGGFIEE